MSLTRSTELNAFLKLLVIDNSNGSLQVIMAIPAVRLRTICTAAVCIRTTSGSREKSYKNTKNETSTNLCVQVHLLHVHITCVYTCTYKGECIQ